MFLILALAFSFLCSLLESSLLSTTLSYIMTREEEGDRSAQLMHQYKSDSQRPLAAILSLNTIANTVGSSGVAATATQLWGNAWLGLASGIMTLLILMFGEIVPKTIGTNNWRSLMGFTAYTLRGLIVVMYPLVIMIEWFTSIFKHNEQDSTVSREEVATMANVGEDEGVIDQQENKIIQNIIYNSFP